MKKEKLTLFLNDTKKALSRHSPAILTGVGITGMITTTVLAVKATPKALWLIEEAEDEKRDDLTPIEMVKATWKCYIPAATTCVFSTACLIGAGSVHARRHAALATAYNLSETAFVEYRGKVIETIGEKKEKTVRDKVAKEKIEQNPPSQSTVIVTGNGDALCYEPASGRYFKSNIDKIKRAEMEIVKEMQQDVCGYASLNEFYDEIGLDRTSIGNEMGWNAMYLPEVDFSSILTEDDQPCVVVNYGNPPKYDFARF